MVFTMPDPKSLRDPELLVREIIPWLGFPEALLYDCGTNLLSHLLPDIC